MCKSRATHHRQVPITCNMSCCVPSGTKGQLSYSSWNHIYFSFIWLAEPLNRWRMGGNRRTGRKPLTMSFRNTVLVCSVLIISFLVATNTLCCHYLQKYVLLIALWIKSMEIWPTIHTYMETSLHNIQHRFHRYKYTVEKSICNNSRATFKHFIFYTWTVVIC